MEILTVWKPVLLARRGWFAALAAVDGSRDGGLAVLATHCPRCVKLVASFSEAERAQIRAELAKRVSGARARSSTAFPPWRGPPAPMAGSTFTTAAGTSIPGLTPKQMEGWGWQSVHDPSRAAESHGAVGTRRFSTGQAFEMIFPLRGADGVPSARTLRAASRFTMRPVTVTRWFGTNTEIESAATQPKRSWRGRSACGTSSCRLPRTSCARPSARCACRPMGSRAHCAKAR